jgi:hypothetical protein
MGQAPAGVRPLSLWVLSSYGVLRARKAARLLDAYRSSRMPLIDWGEHMFRVGRAQGYERFLEMSVPLVLVVLWVAGVVLEVLCVVELYSLYWNGLVLRQLLESF